MHHGRVSSGRKAPLLFLPPLSRCSSSNTFDAVLPQWPLLPWRLRLPALLKLYIAFATATVWANYAYGSSSSYRKAICQEDHSSSIVQGVTTRLMGFHHQYHTQWVLVRSSYNCLWSMISSWRIFVLEYIRLILYFVCIQFLQWF